MAANWRLPGVGRWQPKLRQQPPAKKRRSAEAGSPTPTRCLGNYRLSKRQPTARLNYVGRPRTAHLSQPHDHLYPTNPRRGISSPAADDLVVGLETGEVQTLNLSTGATANLANGMPELVDLAFSSDGLLLAALGKTGAGQDLELVERRARRPIPVLGR